MAIYKQGKWYAFVVACFLYSLIIVDLYRKLVPGGAIEQIRNMVYVGVFCLIIIEMIRSRHLKSMLGLAAVTLSLYFFSYLINYEYSEVYVASIFLFISRLWPAYYIGRYTENWDMVCKSALIFSPFAIAYSAALFIMPDIAGGQAYATIASNLAYVSLLFTYMGFKRKSIVGIACALICLVPVFFYGTRVFFLGIIMALLLLYLLNGSVSKNKLILSFSLLMIIAIVFISYGDSVLNSLSEMFPDSRTLKMLSVGDMFDDSNRGDGIYYKIFNSLSANPIKMYGFIGDRIYLAGAAATTADILSFFSHNCILELCMNFGLFIGLFISFRFLNILRKSTSACFREVDKTDTHYVFVAFLGVTFLDMMVSASYLSAYAVWMLFGLAYKIKNNNIESC